MINGRVFDTIFINVMLSVSIIQSSQYKFSSDCSEIVPHLLLFNPLYDTEFTILMVTSAQINCKNKISHIRIFQADHCLPWQKYAHNRRYTALNFTPRATTNSQCNELLRWFKLNAVLARSSRFAPGRCSPSRGYILKTTSKPCCKRWTSYDRMAVHCSNYKLNLEGAAMLAS